MSQILYDPTGETSSGMRTRLQPLKDLVDKTVMLFDIGKVRSDEFLNYFDQVLQEFHQSSTRYKKQVLLCKGSFPERPH